MKAAINGKIKGAWLNEIGQCTSNEKTT